MANPVTVPIPKETWTLVASNVVTGQLWKKLPANYLYTYVATGDSAPTTLDEAVRVMIGTDHNLPISASTSIDVYIYTTDKDGEIEVHA